MLRIGGFDISQLRLSAERRMVKLVKQNCHLTSSTMKKLCEDVVKWVYNPLLMGLYVCLDLNRLK